MVDSGEQSPQPYDDLTDKALAQLTERLNEEDQKTKTGVISNCQSFDATSEESITRVKEIGSNKYENADAPNFDMESILKTQVSRGSSRVRMKSSSKALPFKNGKEDLDRLNALFIDSEPRPTKSS